MFLLLLKLLLFFDKMDINISNGYNKFFIENIKQHLNTIFLSQNNRQQQISYLSPLRVSNDIKNDIKEYIKIFVKYIFCDTNERQSCQYVLDKIIIYEKYK